MVATQIETPNQTISKMPQAIAKIPQAENASTRQSAFLRHASSPNASRAKPAAFTLVELLVVITIITILAGLITGAAIRALNNAKQAAITFELNQMGSAVEDLKNEMGAYPPNGMIHASTPINRLAINDFVKMFRKAFPRSKENPALIEALAGENVTSSVVSHSDLEGSGMSGEEALYFWLGGFSKDPSYPISGPGGPSFVVIDSGSPEDEVLEDRNRRYEFDLGRLGPRSSAGTFSGRHITYDDPTVAPGTRDRRINLWVYAPKGSLKPIAYFDTSRHSPAEYDLEMADGKGVYALKQLREGIASRTAIKDIRFVEDKKFQILHAGIDDIWGDGMASLHLDATASSSDSTYWENILLAPEGPFIGDIADTLGNFMPGKLEEKQE